MPEDFFAEGFGQEQGPIFSKQEDEFLYQKLIFLDPNKTYQIPIFRVLDLLKYARLESEAIKKIINNSCKNGIGQKTVTYEEMKKIFRGVALKQAKIEPSKINIEANIKTKMPIFYDEDDEQDQEETKPPPKKESQAPKSNPPPKQTSVAPQSVPTNQPPQAPKVQAQMDPFKAYEEYWKNLKTKNNLIDGSEVKKMFTGNNSNKNNLSKAWKLCNISEKGCLTKGEFFIFMNIINNPNIPEALTKEMKDIILKIEEACGYKKAAQTAQSNQQRTSSSSMGSEKVKEKANLNAFDKFGDESLFAKNSSKVEKPVNPGLQKNVSNEFSVPSAHLVPSGTSLNNSGALQLLEKAENLNKQAKTNEKEIATIATNNEQLAAGLGAIQQYLGMVEKNFEATTSQIQILKQNQNALNQRLNSVCFQFKNIITKQSECINYLIESIHKENQSSAQRLEVLQNYTKELVIMVEGKFEQSKGAVMSLERQQKVFYQQVKAQTQNVGMKLGGIQQNKQTASIPRASNDEGNSSGREFQGSPEHDNHNRTDPFDDEDNNHENRESPSNRNFKNTSQEEYQKQSPSSGHQSKLENGNQGHIDLESLSPQQRKKTKQMLLIQILNLVSSMNEQQYTQVVSKVIAMTEEQMNQSYSKLYELYQQNLMKNSTSPKHYVPTPEEFIGSQITGGHRHQPN